MMATSWHSTQVTEMAVELKSEMEILAAEAKATVANITAGQGLFPLLPNRRSKVVTFHEGLSLDAEK